MGRPGRIHGGEEGKNTGAGARHGHPTTVRSLTQQLQILTHGRNLVRDHVFHLVAQQMPRRDHVPPIEGRHHLAAAQGLASAAEGLLSLEIPLGQLFPADPVGPGRGHEDIHPLTEQYGPPRRLGHRLQPLASSKTQLGAAGNKKRYVRAQLGPIQLQLFRGQSQAPEPIQAHERCRRIAGAATQTRPEGNALPQVNPCIQLPLGERLPQQLRRLHHQVGVIIGQLQPFTAELQAAVGLQHQLVAEINGLHHHGQFMETVVPQTQQGQVQVHFGWGFQLQAGHGGGSASAWLKATH